jgi:putative flippase GtrA
MPAMNTMPLAMTEPLPAASPDLGGGAARLARFFAVGAANTLLSIAVYQLLLFVTSHVVAYVLAYAVGILVAYLGYSRHVFGAALSTQRFVRFAMFYVLSCAAGSLINAWLIQQWQWHERLAIFATVLIMLAPNYFGSRWCLRAGANR